MPAVCCTEEVLTAICVACEFDASLYIAGVKWIEIDMPDVLAAKNSRLQLAGAQTEPEEQDCTFPLKAASFKNFSADLNRRQVLSHWCLGHSSVYAASLRQSECDWHQTRRTLFRRTQHVGMNCLGEIL